MSRCRLLRIAAFAVSVAFALAGLGCAPHADAEVAAGQVADANGNPAIAMVRQIAAQRDPAKAESTLVKLLRMKSGQPAADIDAGSIHDKILCMKFGQPSGDIVYDVYPYIGSIRKHLLALATDKKWDKLAEDEQKSVGFKARRMLAYWGDERDEALMKRWWAEQAFDGELHPKIEGDKNIWKAVANWQKATGFGPTNYRLLLRAFDESPGRACVTHWQFLFTKEYSWCHYRDIVLVKREGKWVVLFYVLTDESHSDYQF